MKTRILKWTAIALCALNAVLWLGAGFDTTPGRGGSGGSATNLSGNALVQVTNVVNGAAKQDKINGTNVNEQHFGRTYLPPYVVQRSNPEQDTNTVGGAQIYSQVQTNGTYVEMLTSGNGLAFMGPNNADYAFQYRRAVGQLGGLLRYQQSNNAVAFNIEDDSTAQFGSNLTVKGTVNATGLVTAVAGATINTLVVSNGVTISNNAAQGNTATYLDFSSGNTNSSSRFRYSFGDNFGQTFSWQWQVDTNRIFIQGKNTDTSYRFLVTHLGTQIGKSGETTTNFGAFTNSGTMDVAGALTAYGGVSGGGSGLTNLNLDSAATDTLFTNQSKTHYFYTNGTLGTFIAWIAGTGLVFSNTVTHAASLLTGTNGGAHFGGWSAAGASNIVVDGTYSGNGSGLTNINGGGLNPSTLSFPSLSVTGASPGIIYTSGTNNGAYGITVNSNAVTTNILQYNIKGFQAGQVLYALTTNTIGTTNFIVMTNDFPTNISSFTVTFQPLNANLTSWAALTPLTLNAGSNAIPKLNGFADVLTVSNCTVLTNFWLGPNTNCVVVVSNSSTTGAGVLYLLRITNGVTSSMVQSINLTNGNVQFGPTNNAAFPLNVWGGSIAGSVLQVGSLTNFGSAGAGQTISIFGGSGAFTVEADRVTVPTSHFLNLNDPSVRMNGLTNVQLSSGSGAGTIANAGVALDLKGSTVSGQPLAGAARLVAITNNAGAGSPVMAVSTYAQTAAILGGTIAVSNNAIANAGTAQTNLITYSLPANILTNNGDRIEFTASGRFVANTDTKEVLVVLGSETLFDTTAQIVNVANGAWIVKGEIVRTGNTSQTSWVEFDGAGLSLFTDAAAVTTSQTNGIATLLAIAGTAQASGDITNRTLVVKYFPAP